MKNFTICENNLKNIEIPIGKKALLGSIRREVSVADKAWLAGAIEGEGNISICQTYQRNENHGYKDARIGVVNGNIWFIKKISGIYYDLNVCFYYQLRKGKKPNHQPRLDILTNGLLSCAKILHYIKPYLASKRDEVNVMLEYIGWRKTEGLGKCFDKDKAESYAKRLSWLKHNHFDPSQTTRRASYPLQVEDGDIVDAPMRIGE